MVIQWPENATLTLIRCRCERQDQFCTTAIQSQKRIWREITREIGRRHRFDPDRRQCRTKWNALKTGYENLERLLNGNPSGFPTHTPSLHDERFHEELSDEFWLNECKYLLLKLIYY